LGLQTTGCSNTFEKGLTLLLFMGKKVFIIIFFIVAALGKTLGQQQGSNGITITGAITDMLNKPLPGVAVELVNAADSSLVKTTVSDTLGKYSFLHIKQAHYAIIAYALGYERTFFDITYAAANAETISVNVLQLKAKPNALKDVVVVAQKPFIELKLDKIVVNVENNILSAASSALEVLQKSPGINIDDRGTIYLNGKSGVSVMINGRLTYLSQDQLNAMLKGMPAGTIAQIEIIANPSSKYDAAGNGGIINIKLKKTTKDGFNGSAYSMIAQGRYGQQNAGINLNYRTGKFNFYGSYNAALSKYWTISTANTIFYDNNKQEVSILARNANGSFSSTSNNMQTGITYVINKKSNIGFQFNKVWNNYRTNDIRSVNSFLTPSQAVDSFTVSHTNANSSFNSLLYDINYTLALDTTGSELSASADYSKFNLPETQYFSTAYFNADGVSTRPEVFSRNDQPINIDVKSLKVDYTHPFNAKEKFEAGIKMSIVNTDNVVTYQDKVNATWIVNNKMSNHFEYSENINAAYANFSGEYKKGWSFQAGLRVEQTVSKAAQITIDSVVRRNYVQLFPNVVIQKQLGKNQTLSLSYSRRIDRPDYESLNPFLYYIDAFNYQKGNSYLQPQLTNSITVTHIYKNRVITSLNYSQTNAAIVNINTQNDSTHITYQSTVNLSSYTHLGVNISTPLKITKWWMSNNSVNIFYNKYNGRLAANDLSQGKLTSYISSNNTFMLPFKFKLELSGFWQSSQQSGAFVIKPVYSVSSGIQRSFLNNSLNIRLAVNDVLNTWRSRSYLKFGNVDANYETRWMSRTVSLSVNYNFGNSKQKSFRRASAIQEEKNRINK
jgi:hypothetical protein